MSSRLQLLLDLLGEVIFTIINRLERGFLVFLEE